MRLLLIGNHGTMEFADVPGADTRAADLAPPANTKADTLARAIEHSLQSHAPIAPEGKPWLDPRSVSLLVTGGMTHQENYGAGFLADPRAKIVGLTDEPSVDERRDRLNRALADAFGVPFLPDLRDALARRDVHAGLRLFRV